LGFEDAAEKSAPHWACWAADDLAGFKRQVPHYLKKKNLTYGYC